MKEEKDYIRDLAEIRSMMERTSKFLSLSGWAGIMAGVYALAGAYLAYTYFHFKPEDALAAADKGRGSLPGLVLVALATLVLAVGTAVFLSAGKARKRGEKLWNATSGRLLVHMSVPLMAGGLLILVLMSKGLLGLVAPVTLIFYGLALYNAGKFTYSEIRILGLLEICLGLVSAYFIGCSLLLWAVGFGLLHIVCGIYLHYRYER